jgi:hypothetical protein
LTSSQDGGYIINLSGTLFDRHMVHFSTADCNKKSDSTDAVKHLKEIMENKKENYYRLKLVNLWFLLTGKKSLCLEKIYSSINENKLPADK